MNLARFVVSGSAVVAVVLMSGCDPQAGSAGSTTPPVPVASSAAPVSAAPSVAAIDAVTVKACGDLKKDIKENAARVAKAEKIGPPVGNVAVSAQWAAGSTAVIAHSIGANDAVSAAADKVQKEMMALGDAYNKSASAKPSKKKLDAAVKELNAACAAP